MKTLKTIEVIDQGKTMTIDVSELPTGIIKQDLSDGTVKGINLAYSVAGAWLPKNVKVDENGVVIDERVDSSDFAIHGLNTKQDQLPQAGTAQYNGSSLGAITSGKMQLDVDFGNKTLIGKLYERKFDNGQKLEDIVLQKGTIRTISGAATFDGVASYKGVQGTYIGGFMAKRS